MAEIQESPISRRSFLWVILLGIGSILSGLAGWSIFNFLTPNNRGGENTKVSLKLADVPVGKAHLFQYQGRPAILLQPQPGHFVALSAVCTHLGCIVKWLDEKQIFLCPCHGGQFSPQGEVIGGPPPQPLKHFPVTVTGDVVVVG